MSQRTPSHWPCDPEEFADQGVLQRRVPIVQLQRVGPPGEIRVPAVGENPFPGSGLEAPVVLGFGRQPLLGPGDEEVRVLPDPVVVGRHMVRDEIEEELQAAPAHPLAESRERLVAAEVGVDVVVTHRERGAGDVGVPEVGENAVILGHPLRIRRRHPARGFAGLPDAEEPDDVEAVARELVQLVVRHVVQRRGPAERFGTAPTTGRAC